jgi:hypothetical protein
MLPDSGLGDECLATAGIGSWPVGVIDIQSPVQLVSTRCEKSSIISTSNLPFLQWKILGQGRHRLGDAPERLFEETLSAIQSHSLGVDRFQSS